MAIRYISIFVISIFLTTVITGQTVQETKTINLYKAQEWAKLAEYTERQLALDTFDGFTTVLMKFYRTHSMLNTGKIRESFIETEKIFNDYSDEDLTDSLMAKIMVNVCQKLSYEAIESQRNDIGLNAVKRGIRLCENRLSNDHGRMSDMSYNASAIYSAIGELDTALLFVVKGKEAAEHLEDKEKREAISMHRNEEAIIYWKQNKLKQTKEIFNKELQQALKDSNYYLQTRFHINLGIANESLFDYGKSEYHLKKGLETNQLKKIEQELDEYILSYNLARVYGSLKKYDKAEAMLLKSLEAAKKLYGEDSPRVGGVYVALGNAYTKQKKYKDARIYYEKNLDNLKLNYSEESSNYTDYLTDYGGTLINEGALEEGISLIKRSITNRTKLGESYDNLLSVGNVHLTSAYLGKNDLISAKKHLDESLRNLEYNYDEGGLDFNSMVLPKRLISPLTMRYAYLNKMITTKGTFSKTSILEEVSKLDNIVDSLVRHIKYNFEDLNSRKTFVQDMQPLYQSRLDLYYQLFNEEEQLFAKAFNLSERTKNTFLYEAIAEKENNLNALTNDIYLARYEKRGNINNTKTQLDQYTADTENDNQEIIDSLGKALTSAQHEHYELLNDIKKNNPGYYSYVYDYPITSVGEIQDLLGEDQMLVIFAEGIEDQLVISMTKTEQKLYNLGSKNTINLAIQEYLDYCKNPKAKSEFTYDLTNLLIAPLNLDKQKINFVLDGLLAMLPMETLLDSEGVQLIYNHDITYNYSATLIADKKHKTNNSGDILAMAPVFEDESQRVDPSNLPFYAEVIRGASIIPLPGTNEEVNAIKSIFGGQIFTKRKATKSAFFENASDKSLIHLATHGIINEIEPSLSGLIFNAANGEPEELLVSEIIQMDLNADLVTLSACNTGTGKIINGEGVSSLGRAFSYAGCANQVLSLWAVNDNTTTEIMTNYYHNLNKGEGKSIALKNAKMQYIKNAPKLLQHPYYWAGFVYYGKDTPLDMGSKYTPWFWGLIALVLISILVRFLRSKKS